MKTWADVFVYTTTLGAYGFLFRFLLTTWYRTVAGRIVMALAVVAVLIFSLAALTSTLGQDFPARQALRLGCYIGTTALSWWALAVLWSDQIRSRNRRLNRGNRDQ